MRKSLVLALVLSALLLVTVMAVSVSADASLTIGTVTYSKDVDNDIVTFTVPYTAVDVDQITVLAVKGPQSAEPVATESNIVYFNQQSSVSSSFTFSVPYSKFSVDSPYCWIKIGGTSIATAQSDGGREIWSDSVSVFVYGDVNDDAYINISDAVAVLNYIQFVIVSGDDAAIDTTTFPAGDNTRLLADVNADGDVNISDAVMILSYIGTVASGGTEALDPIQFPDGKFPAYSKK